MSKALEIDSDHPAANAYLAWDTMLVNGDYINAAEQFERALGIDPYDWEVLRGNILFASIIGRTDIADVLGRIAITRNPLCGPCHRHVSRSLFRAGLFDLAEISLLNVMDLLPPGRSTTELALIRYMKGDHDGLQRVASDYLARARPEDQDIAIVRHIELLGAVLRGETGGLQVEIDEFAHRWGDRHLRSCAELYAETGQLDKAFELFERGYGTQYNSDLAAGLMNPLFRKMTEDPRWKAWQEKAGIAPHQLAVIEYQPNLPPAEGLVKLKPGDLASE
ncbi:MAG: hypothetical protein HKN15_11535 [Xanthomonadales bacterium]|nr:hypothetical protein [Xanthomonadales bacterium]